MNVPRLIQDLRNVRFHADPSNPVHWVEAVCKDAADWIERTIKWIPVSERLPEVGEPVLCCWSRQKIGMGIAMRRDLWGKVAWTNVDQWDEIDEPIAWMRLPEPPEVK